MKALLATAYLMALGGIVIIAATMATSCAGVSVRGILSTPYGDVTTDPTGHVIIAPRPIIIPQK